jgi:16S rRNA U1498 N3-methylase RsmE
VVVLVEPSAGQAAALMAAPMPRPDRATLFVGPEGGWAAEELRRFRDAGATLATLPGPTWRADAIGLIGIVLLDVMWEGREGWTAWRPT